MIQLPSERDDNLRYEAYYLQVHYMVYLLYMLLYMAYPPSHSKKHLLEL